MSSSAASAVDPALSSCAWEGWVQKKSFKAISKDKWAKRWMIFDPHNLVFEWFTDQPSSGTATRQKDPNNRFILKAEDLAFEPTQEHRRSFEIVVKSDGKALFFTPSDAKELNRVIVCLDSARRIKVSAVEVGADRTFFRNQDAILTLGDGVVQGEPGAKVFSWGVGAQLGTNNGSVNGIAVPQRISAFKSDPQVTAIACGPEHAMALTADSVTGMWGSNEFFQLAQAGDVPLSLRPLPIKSLEGRRVLQVACGGSHTIAIVAESGSSFGTLFSWGTGTVGQLGLGSAATVQSEPTSVPLRSRAPVTSVYAGLVSSGALLATGEALLWGDNSAGRLGLASTVPLPAPGAMPTFVGADVVWEPRLLKIDPASVGQRLGAAVHVVCIALGGTFSLFMVWTDADAPGCVLLVSGTLGADITRDTWGYTPASEDALNKAIDLETLALQVIATPTPTETFYTRPVILGVSAGPRHAAVIVADAVAGNAPRVFTAGKGWLGHAGSSESILLETPKSTSKFAPVAGALAAEDIVEAACGHSHTLVRTSNGRVFAWGRGDSGELGTGNLSDRTLPTPVRTIKGHIWMSVAAGSYFSLGITTPGHIALQAPEVTSLALKARWLGIAHSQSVACGSRAVDVGAAGVGGAGGGRTVASTALAAVAGGGGRRRGRGGCATSCHCEMGAGSRRFTAGMGLRSDGGGRILCASNGAAGRARFHRPLTPLSLHFLSPFARSTFAQMARRHGMTRVVTLSIM